MKENCLIHTINHPGTGKVVSPRPYFPFKNTFLSSEDFIQHISTISIYHYLRSYPPHLHGLQGVLLLIISWFNSCCLCLFVQGHPLRLGRPTSRGVPEGGWPLLLQPLTVNGSSTKWRRVAVPLSFQVEGHISYFLNCNDCSPPYCLIKQLLFFFFKKKKLWGTIRYGCQRASGSFKKLNFFFSSFLASWVKYSTWEIFCMKLRFSCPLDA